MAELVARQSRRLQVLWEERLLDRIPTASSSERHGRHERPQSVLTDFYILRSHAFDYPTPTSFSQLQFLSSSVASNDGADYTHRVPKVEERFCSGFFCCGVQLDDLVSLNHITLALNPHLRVPRIHSFHDTLPTAPRGRRITNTTSGPNA